MKIIGRKFLFIIESEDHINGISKKNFRVKTSFPRNPYADWLAANLYAE
jgi:hypothetical protein